MAVIYKDTTLKYGLSTSGIVNSSMSTLDNIFNGIGNVIKSILPFEAITSLKNQRNRDEQNYLLNADKLGYDAENKVNIIVIVVVVAIVVVMAKKM